MKTIKPETWIPNDNIILEEAAIDSVHSMNNTLVIAGPGAGKTELLAQKASYLFQTNLCKNPRKILAISFKKDAAANLKERVLKRCGKEIESRFISLTYDAFAKSILDHFRLALEENYRPSSNYSVNNNDVVKNAFDKIGINDIKSPQYDQILTNVSFPFNRSNKIEQVWKLLLKGFDEYPATLSFAMITKLAIFIIKANPKIKKCLQITYQYIFLDEFQDTTSLQYDFVKCCFMNSSSLLTAVGDNKQRIMQWAGALKDIFSLFISDFNANQYKLIMNHRSAPKLVELQKMMYYSLNEPNIEIQCSKKWKPDDGEIKLLMNKREDEEVNYIVNDIVNKIKAGKNPNELCILCKQIPEKYTSMLREKLKNEYDICARIETEYQDLLKEPIIEILIAWIELSLNLNKSKNYELILNTLVECMDFDNNQIAYDKRLINIYNKLNYTKNLILQTKSKDEFSNIIDYIMEFLFKQKIITIFPQYSQGNYLNNIIQNFKEKLWEELKSTNIEWTTALENFQGLHSIPIMTIHKSKGLEYDTIYFIGLEDNAFWNFKKQPQEDRCVFFVALSRAKYEIIFSYSNYRYEKIHKNQSNFQSHININEFFELLKNSNLVTIIDKIS